MNGKLHIAVHKSYFYSAYKYLKLKRNNYILWRTADKTFKKEFRALQRLNTKSQNRFIFNWNDKYPCLGDKTDYASYDRHYVLHPAWAARILYKLKTEVHHDISSTLYFGTMVSSFLKLKFYDYRPAKLTISDFESNHADLLNLPFESGSIQSISCMHTIEHIGLGRYGDPLDYNGDLKAIKELKRVVGKGGNLLVVVPLASKPRINFNAHRVYSTDQFLSYFTGLELIEFCLIPENETDGDLVINPSEELLSKQIYGCGCFWFKKPSE